jgi:pyruvate dehydrogenase E1 component alpha subunit
LTCFFCGSFHAKKGNMMTTTSDTATQSHTFSEKAPSNYAAQERDYDRKVNLEYYRQMLAVRRMEEKAAEAYTQGKIGGFLHLYIGQEAVAIGVVAALREKDHLVTHYRDHGYAYAKGTSMDTIMAELYGKSGGTCGGRGGSMHLANVEKHFWGGYAIVGGHLPLATGIAHSIKYNGLDEVVVCVMGEGSTNIGMFHESLNIAALWELPIVYLVENNLFGMGTSVATHSSLTEINQKSRAYGFPGDRFDGMDVWTVRDHVKTAVERARSGGGPTLLEAMTYRFRGHSMADAQLYRTKQEIEEWRSTRDPLESFAQKMLKYNILSEDDIKQVTDGVEVELEAAVKFAEESPFPTPESLYEGIFAEKE